ncbi:hypothetical protein AcW1_003347 [Taiwanofungus camphoratus]|nr:hypothetical protein AcV5_002179 [Antrodia cinnamomea]KAI0941463.1 hypothetical protein AcW1_003347 [Antrodia cinnamomea]KAI0944040.1 hypothetical protein AcV7_001969 [Antrodia cinnamomea]
MKVFAASSVLLSLVLGVVNAQSINGTGTLFYFNPGVGACGFTNTSDQYVASVSSHTFYNYPGATQNPNTNPICNHNLTVAYNGTNVTAQVVDYCVSCGDSDVGLSPVGFEHFANTSQGVISNVSWIIN